MVTPTRPRNVDTQSALSFAHAILRAEERERECATRGRRFAKPNAANRPRRHRPGARLPVVTGLYAADKSGRMHPAGPACRHGNAVHRR